MISICRLLDGLAEKYASFTPYKYSLNNPVNVTDPNGMDENATSSISALVSSYGSPLTTAAVDYYYFGGGSSGGSKNVYISSTGQVLGEVQSNDGGSGTTYYQAYKTTVNGEDRITVLGQITEDAANLLINLDKTNFNNDANHGARAKLVARC